MAPEQTANPYVVMPAPITDTQLDDWESDAARCYWQLRTSGNRRPTALAVTRGNDASRILALIAEVKRLRSAAATTTEQEQP